MAHEDRRRMMADSDWIEATLDEYEGPLLRYAYSLLRNWEQAQDVVQDTFLQLCRQPKSKVSDHLAQWLFIVCRNRAFDLREKESRIQPMNEERSRSLQDLGASPLRILSAREGLERAMEALSNLPSNQQEVLRLKLVHEFSYRQISEITGHSVSNVGFLIHTGLKSLRQKLSGVGLRKSATTIRRVQ